MFFTLKAALAQSGFRPPWWVIVFCVLGILFAGTTFALLGMQLIGRDPKPKLESLWEQLRTGVPPLDKPAPAPPEPAGQPDPVRPQPRPAQAIDWTVASPELDTIAFIDWAKTELRQAITRVRYHQQLITQERKHYGNLLAEAEKDHHRLYEAFVRLKRDYFAATAVAVPDQLYRPAEGTFVAKELRRELLAVAKQATSLCPELTSTRASLRAVGERLEGLNRQLTRARDLGKTADLKLRVFSTTGEVRGLEELRIEILALTGLVETPGGD